MPKLSKEELSSAGSTIMQLAKAYREKHPGVKWQRCVAIAGKMFKKMNNK